MPLSNIAIINFQLPSFLANDSTVGNQVWTSSNYVEVADTNTFPKSALIVTAASTSTENPVAGSEGYWGFGTNNLTISGYEGQGSWKWLTHTTSLGEPYFFTNPSCQLKNTEYDPGGGAGYSTLVNSNTDLRIGYDFWQYNLLQENGESYEPTSGQPSTYYKYWLHPDLNQQNVVGSGLYPEYAENWNPLVKKIVAVNSMPLNSMMKAQQGNKIFVIVIFKDNLFGQDFIDAGNEIRVDLDGNPDFTEFVENEENQFTEEWQTEAIGDETEDTETGGGTTTTGNVSSDTTQTEVVDGIDADDSSSVVNNSTSEDQQLNVSVSDSEEDESWGNDGLTESEIDAGANNTSGYDTIAAESSSSVDEDEGSSSTFMDWYIGGGWETYG